jgi:transcriptional regulator of heat shock response
VPQEGDATVRRIELVPVTPTRIAVMIADNFGRVRTQVASLKESISSEELSALSSLINDNLTAVSVDNLVPTLYQRIQTMLDDRRRLAIGLGYCRCFPARQSTMFLEGATQLFEQPEFMIWSRARF